MQNVYSVEDLIINDSFINYCHLENPEDISIWESYLLQNPFEKATVEEAKLFILGLNSMLKTVEKDIGLERFKKALNDKQPGDSRNSEPNVAYIVPDRTGAGRNMKYIWYAAASVIVIIIAAVWISSNKTDRRLAVKAPEEVSNMVLTENSVTKTGAGERKVVFLPDGTKVTMNVKTTLTVDSSFGMNARLVKLDGEAFFDVQHDTRSPFIVQLKDFKVKVLGTMFNVRSYSGDKNSETALVKGKVEIEKNNSHEKLFLKPYEKAILPNNPLVAGTSSHENFPAKNFKPLPFVVKPLTISHDGNSISETGWMQNRLEINDETFLELKNKLERWYGVKIRFDDEEVKQYKFTATFENENIDQALKAMQLSYQFNYTKKDNQIMIVK
jgi:transmembrane sensor